MRPTLFLITLTASISSTLFGGEVTTAEVNVQSQQPGLTIPADFMGLSYEKSAIAENHFRPDNTFFVNLHRNLGEGVLRIGGNKVELCDWQLGKASGTNPVTPVTPQEVDQFYSFIKGINWKVIYGVNLASNDPENSAEEISYASKRGGKSIVAFEIGNEPDHYYLPPRKTFREKGYSYPQYKKELSDALRVISAKNPGAPLTGPANTESGNEKWFAPCVEDFKREFTFVTSHFYPTTNKEPFPTIETLLAPETEAKSVQMAEANMVAARKAGLPWRLAECNSTSLGGTAGVSDVYAAAVWGSDFLFDIAERGAAGINFHTILGLNGYTAIAFDKKSGKYSVRPLYYSLLLFKDAGHGKILPTQTKSSANVTAHSTLGEDRKIRVVVINKDLNHAATTTVNTNTARAQGTIARLSGSSPSGKEAISYAGMTVGADGNINTPKTEPIKGSAGKFTLTLPACSAAVLTVDPI